MIRAEESFRAYDEAAVSLHCGPQLISWRHAHEGAGTLPCKLHNVLPKPFQEAVSTYTRKSAEQLKHGAFDCSEWKAFRDEEAVREQRQHQSSDRKHAIYCARDLSRDTYRFHCRIVPRFPCSAGYFPC
jgi:hypothetical protein